MDTSDTGYSYSEFYPVVDGEINGDGVVDVGDLNALASMICGKKKKPNWDDVAANLTYWDVSLDTKDVDKLVEILLGKWEGEGPNRNREW